MMAAPYNASRRGADALAAHPPCRPPRPATQSVIALSHAGSQPACTSFSHLQMCSARRSALAKRSAAAAALTGAAASLTRFCCGWKRPVVVSK